MATTHPDRTVSATTPPGNEADIIPDALEAVRRRIVDLSVLADSTALWLERLPRGDGARERTAVENVSRLVDRMARDLRRLAAVAHDAFAEVVALAGGESACAGEASPGAPTDAAPADDARLP